ncbi:aminoglycoside phosphotransferase family protein [Roseomonas xinghualingensis]|uniref:aminoglycoside phosphotransferase family protein n=1 Tax=Roseomonas xinghualingensis TaxID=2986475 RepID=UPI0021F2268D|nr:phosphotransferase [Roseomonas sp. SXEYE001]MCV4208244.1 phosphotransferase [Roseomonas sp. SXEYE001]
MSLDSFLATHGYAGACRVPLPGDAGHRRYLRMVGGPRPALLMDGSGAAAVGLPSAEADLRSFIVIAAHIRSIGLSAPEVLAADPPAGLLLLEDLGEPTHATLLDAGAEPLPLYLAAAETLAALHEAPPPAGLPAWEGAAMARASGATFLDWWWPAALGAEPTAAQREGFHATMGAMLKPFEGRGGFVHRDYFPANLLPLPERPGPASVGVIDFQDAGHGHPAYDLVSLLQDARRDVPDEVRQAATARYLERRSGLDREEFEAATAVMAAQRHLRVASLWVRLDRRDGKPHYLRHGPRCWRLLDAALAHPAAAPLATFLDEHVPRDLRANPVMEPAA